ncbi:GNAT family N-acetyltransferase [Solitalea canadensis]|nr:GNAT family N-acetyltransferase [Solitalea canadensis]
MNRFYEIKDVGSREFLAAMDIYREAFPDYERHAQQVIEDRIVSGRELLFVAVDENNSVGLMALVWDLKGTDFIVLDYLAVASSTRGQGIGGQFMEFINQWVLEHNKILLFEIEHPDYGTNTEQRLKRLVFYERYGAKKIEKLIYYLPNLAEGAPKEMLLMTIPPVKISAELLKQAVGEIYLHLYGLNEEHDLVKRFNQQIGGF